MRREGEKPFVFRIANFDFTIRAKYFRKLFFKKVCTNNLQIDSLFDFWMALVSINYG
jgi:hypothetical protein